MAYAAVTETERSGRERGGICVEKEMLKGNEDEESSKRNVEKPQESDEGDESGSE